MKEVAICALAYVVFDVFVCVMCAFTAADFVEGLCSVCLSCYGSVCLYKEWLDML